MIKICSLDFLNKENFETNVMTSDGKVLFCSGEKITPDIILRLYFRDIYIEKPLVKEEETVQPETLKEEDNAEEIIAKELILVNLEKLPEDDSRKSPHKVELEAKEVSEQSRARKVELEDIEEEIASGTEEPLPDMTPAELEEIDYTIINEKFDEDYVAESSVPADKLIEEAITEKEEFLKFDEQQASKLAEYSAKLGKILNFSKNELEELKQAAYYCNIGITKFKEEDLDKKGFEKRMALESYEIILNEMNMSEKIAEAAKFCVNNYDSDTFSLDTKIPYYHIIAIINYYEKLLSQNNSKQKILEKMLQLGGNKFNIFVLHKFIKMMREINE